MSEIYNFNSFEDVLLNLLCSNIDLNKKEDNSKVGYIANLIKKDQSPKEIYLCGYPVGEEKERLYAADLKLFRLNPFDLAKREYEALICFDDSMMWQKFVNIKKPSKLTSSPLSRVTHFEQHLIEYDLKTGQSKYGKDYYSVYNKTGLRAPLFANGKRVTGHDNYKESFILTMGALDDFFRSGSYKVTLELEKKIHISATPEEVYALLSIRNGPIANIKKRPVIHWVQNRKAIATDKKSFLRGTEKFEIDGIAITVAPDFL